MRGFIYFEGLDFSFRGSWLGRNYDFLLVFPSVRRWLGDVGLYRSGSGATRRLYLKGLLRFVVWSGLMPDRLVVLARSDSGRVADLVRGFARFLVEDGLTRGSAAVYLSCLRSFFEYNELDVRIRFPSYWTRYVDRRPSKGELRDMMRVVGLRVG